MILSKELEKMLNQQVTNEFGASMQYLQIASYFDEEDLVKFAELFFEQAQEERDHAMKLLDYINEAGGHVSIGEVAKPIDTFSSAEEAVKAALTWEEDVTKQIYNLMDIAIKDGDYISQNFLKWFVDEQLEEISKMGTILAIVKRSADNLLIAEQYVMDALPEEPAAE